MSYVPENTSKRDPLLLLAAAWGNPNGYIEEMEAAGQRQLVASEVLPKDGSEHYASVGITVTGNTSDDMFVNVTLPDGWSKRPTDHSMWSEVVDEMGRKRVGVFYKAAPYDRRAFGTVQTVDAYVWDVVNHDGRPIVTDDVWATPEAVRTAAEKWAVDEDKRAVEADGFAVRPDLHDRADYWTERADEHRATAEKYRTLAASFVAKEA